ncbi:MAG: sigma-54-dependent Fis family transcriptional regulator [Desulfobulbaceae bacterium]|nr:sigma-54-dependent Fis family transcriptional regulator [Desulfobulbaceae bacterium]
MSNPKALYPSLPILLVDDEETWLNSFSLLLRTHGINNLRTCSDSHRVLASLAAAPCSLLLLDLTMPHLSGEELLTRVVQEHPEVPVIILTGLDLVETAVNCMRLGAYDFFTKVSEEERLISGVRRALELAQLRQEHATLKKHLLADSLDHPEAFVPLVTHNKAMRTVFQYVEAIATTGEPVLITGETGTGKELIARALHEVSGRQGAFVPVNIAGLDETMLADTLFGHRKGAFTGAERHRPGLVEQANGGTLFLDEIGDLAPNAQLKLLRLIQEREYLPLGSDLPRRADCRMVFATHRPLEAMHREAGFRRDLLFRLQTHQVRLPALRERLDDLPLLLDHFLSEAAGLLQRKKPSYPQELLLLLSTYDYPGNLRELRNMVLEAVSLHQGGMLGQESFKKYLRAQRGEEPTTATAAAPTPFSSLRTLPTLKEAGRLLVEEALQRVNGNQRLAAEMLGVTRQALNWRLNQADEREEN